MEKKNCFMCLTYETFIFHSATCSCIVDYCNNTFADFFPKLVCGGGGGAHSAPFCVLMSLEGWVPAVRPKTTILQYPPCCMSLVSCSKIYESHYSVHSTNFKGTVRLDYNSLKLV
jgi:hypothetical protein